MNDFAEDIANFRRGADMSDALYSALYDYYCSAGEMPYGVAEARTGDPYEWVYERFEKEMDEV